MRRIEGLGFGWIAIDGKRYTTDLIIYPDETIEEGWQRTHGHRLGSQDIIGLIESWPDVIIAATGMYGRLKPEKDLEELLAHRGIPLLAERNERAATLYGELSGRKRVGICFHLTC